MSIKMYEQWCNKPAVNIIVLVITKVFVYHKRGYISKGWSAIHIRNLEILSMDRDSRCETAMNHCKICR